MSDPLIRLAGRTLGLLPVLQPRLMSMFGSEGAEMLETSPVPNFDAETDPQPSVPIAKSPLISNSESPLISNSGGAGIEYTIESAEDRGFMPPSTPGRGIEGEGEVFGMTQLVPGDRPLLPLTRFPRSLTNAIVETRFEPITERTAEPITESITERTAEPITERTAEPMAVEGGRSVAPVDPIPLTPLKRGDRREGGLERDLERRIESSVERRIESSVEPKIESSVELTREIMVQRSPDRLIASDRPSIPVPAFTNLLVPPDRPILPLTRLPRSLTNAIVETRFEPITERTAEPITERTAEPMAVDGGRSVAPVDPIPLIPLERGDRREGGLERDLERDLERGLERGLEPRIESSVKPRIESNVEPRIEPKMESSVESRIEPNVKPRIESNVEPRIESSVELRIESNVESNVELTREMIVRRSPDRSIAFDRPSVPVPAFTNLLVPPDRLTLPLTRLPRSLMTAIVETQFEPITELERLTHTDPSFNLAKPWQTAPPPLFLDARKGYILGEPNPKSWIQSSPILRNLGLKDLGNEETGNGVNASESLMPRARDDRSEQVLESKLELLTALNPIALTPLESLRDAVVKSVGLVRPNPAAMNNRANSQNLLKQAKKEVLQDNLQSISTDLDYEPRNEFQNKPTANPSLEPTSPTPYPSPTPLPSPTARAPLKVPLTKGDLGGSRFVPITHSLSNLEPDILAISPPALSSGGVRNQSPIAPTIAITIGRISIRGVPPTAPPPSRSTRSNRPQVSLNDYLKSRNGGNG